MRLSHTVFECSKGLAGMWRAHQQMLLRLRRFLQLLPKCFGPLTAFCPPSCVLDLLPLAAALSRLPGQLVLVSSGGQAF